MQYIDDSSQLNATLEKIERRLGNDLKFQSMVSLLYLKWSNNFQSIPHERWDDLFAKIWCDYNAEAFGLALSRFVLNTTADTFHRLLRVHLEKLKSSSCMIGKGVELAMIPVYLDSMLVCLKYCLSAWKVRFSEEWSDLLSIISRICRISPEFSQIQVCIRIALHLITTNSFEMKPAQLSLFFDILCSLQENGELHLSESDSLMLFESYYQILYSLARYRREGLLRLIPLYLQHITVMINCFAPSQDTLGKPLIALATVQHGSQPAKLIPRLIFQLSQKPVSGDGEKIDMVKPFSKHVPFFITQLLHLPSSLKQILGEEYKLALFGCLDVCDDFGRNMVLAALDGPLQALRPVYKAVVGEWEKEHRYHGKA
jgi:hypothetical protein